MISCWVQKKVQSLRQLLKLPQFSLSTPFSLHQKMSQPLLRPHICLQQCFSNTDTRKISHKCLKTSSGSQTLIPPPSKKKTHRKTPRNWRFLDLSPWDWGSGTVLGPRNVHLNKHPKWWMDHILTRADLEPLVSAWECAPG